MTYESSITLPPVAAVDDWRDAAIATLQQQLVDARMETDRVQRGMADVVRERDAMIGHLRYAIDCLRGADCPETARAIKEHATKHCEAFGDE